MLFKDYHMEQIRSGSKTVTRREWERRQAKPDGVYIASTEMFTSHDEADCYIRVDDVYQQALGDMTDEDARAEGDYEDLADFRAGYELVYGEGSWDPEKVVWVIEFEYVGRDRPD
ncbi:ASCH domain-containing protein [Natronosalvus rutilus]|uniref:ASCH domain-containing protein n=1 Tax=Natronosalvus rutilus TaxID=2953753 RepID=A0A9E7NFG1_9EURY|nr:ASCH domain-containing protein [Natronosalvus rutilus]UTF56030.1 ASCH domain-containing protein [Natronosalvus rutilus]